MKVLKFNTNNYNARKPTIRAPLKCCWGWNSLASKCGAQNSKPQLLEHNHEPL